MIPPRYSRYVANEDYRPSISAFAQHQGIQILHHRISVNKEPFGEMEEDIVADALSQILDARNHPILVHCNKGKVSCVCERWGCPARTKN